MRNFTWGFILITIGLFILLDNLDVLDFGTLIREYWPLLLILWGFSILLRRGERARRRENTPVSPAFPPGQEVTSEILHQSNVFGDITIRISSAHFKGGSISTVFGDINLDLSAAAVAEGEHELRLHSVFGSSVVMLPREAAVSIGANTLFGDLMILGQPKKGFSVDLQTATPGYEGSASKLKLHLSKVFGDVTVVQ